MKGIKKGGAYRRAKRGVAGALSLALWSAAGLAQESPPGEPLWEELQAKFKTKPLSFGALLQVVADFQRDRTFTGENGFSVANMRLSAGGEFDSGFGYFLQANFIRSIPLLDANLSYTAHDLLSLKAGAFKAPFGREFLVSAASIDFVNRAQAVSALVPGRQIGVQLSGRAGEDRWSYAAGVFNGNGVTANVNDGGRFMYAGRVTVKRAFGEGPSAEHWLAAGASGAFSQDEEVSLMGDLLPGFSGHRTLAGGDLRYVYGKLLLGGEGIAAWFDPQGAPSARPFGYQITAGWRTSGRTQLLGRWDSFYRDGVAPDSHLALAGFNLWPTKATELQVNYVVPVTQASFRHHRLLVNVQVAF